MDGMALRKGLWTNTGAWDLNKLKWTKMRAAVTPTRNVALGQRRPGLCCAPPPPPPTPTPPPGVCGHARAGDWRHDTVQRSPAGDGVLWRRGAVLMGAARVLNPNLEPFNPKTLP
jgi:hypothetical protein